MKTADVEMIVPVMEKSIAAGIFEKNNVGTNRFCANLNCVAKPSIDNLEYTKADKMINRSLGIIGNRNRICIDMRSLNNILGEVPIVTLPNQTN